MSDKEHNCLGGFVTSKKDFDGKFNALDDGLFSQVIFGPEHDHQCKCGRLCGIVHKDQVCSKCGVLCGSSDLRNTQCGKVYLPLYQIKPTKVNRLKKEIVHQKYKRLIEPSDIYSNLDDTNFIYLAVKSDFSSIFITENPKTTNNHIVVPFPLKGICSLYIALRFMSSKLNVPLAKELINDCFIKTLKVLPPNVRQVSIDTVKNDIRTPEINTYYNKIIVKNKQVISITASFDDEVNDLFEQFIYNLKQGIDDPIIEPIIDEFDQHAAEYQNQINLIYQWVWGQLSGKEGMIRSNILGKTIEFSARTVVRCEPSLPAYKIKVSKHILRKLWMPYFIHYLTKIRDFDYVYCFNNFVIKDEQDVLTSEFCTYFDQFLDWFCNNPDNDKKRLMIINRQPSLWRHSLPCVLAEPCDDIDDKTIGVSPLMLEPLNMDFDGDTAALYVLHSNDSLEELYNKAYLLNDIYYDSDHSKLLKIRHESLYAVFILTQAIENDKPIIRKINSLSELDESIELFNNHLYDPVQLGDELFSYGICLLNKWCQFDHVKINKIIDKKSANLITDKIFEYVGEHIGQTHDIMSELNKKLLFFISTTKHCPSIDIQEMASLLDDNTKHLFKKLPNTIDIGYAINESLISRCLENMDSESTLYKLYASGARFNKQQLARSVINIGYTADADNIIKAKPIKSNLVNGLTREDFFLSSPGSRKGIIDKSKQTPNSGYMERTLTMALSVMEIVEDDCGSERYLETIVFDNRHAQSLIGKYFKFLPTEDDLKLITKDNAKQLINTKIYLRSPMGCDTKDFKICRKCFGERQFPTRYVGITAGQILAERLTQLIMRSFHTSGSANIDVNPAIIDFIKVHLIDIREKRGNTLLTFDRDVPKSLLQEFGGQYYRDDRYTVSIPINETNVENKDAISVMEDVKQMLKKQDGHQNPFNFYDEFMSHILNVGVPYSSFVEMLFANMFLVEDGENWRYNWDKRITYKVSDKKLAFTIRPLLGCLYQPNKNTIKAIKSFNALSNISGQTIYEKLFLGHFSEIV